MDDSILISIKKMLGIDPKYPDFDLDIITLINSAFNTLYQIGFEPARTFTITGEAEQWTDIPEEDIGLINMIKQYIFMKVRMLFDPPTSSFVLESIKSQTAELEWRIYVQSESGGRPRREW